MARITEQHEIDPAPLEGKRIGIVGFGSQGSAHAMNLRDGGLKVQVGLPESSRSRDKAVATGFTALSPPELAAWADVLVLAVPDVAMPSVFESLSLRPQQALVFLHGFAVHFGFVEFPAFVDVVLVSPAGPGPGLREQFLKGSGFASLMAVHQDASGRAEGLALAYARESGCAAAGVISTTFEEETVADLFGEQAVLCGGLPELVKAGFDTLVRNGVQPEVAFFECMHQVRLIADLLYRGGLTGMRGAISSTAEWGGFVSGEQVIGEASREGMQRVLDRVRSGEFAREWMAEHASGEPRLQKAREKEAAEQIEAVGESLRRRMTFLDE